MGAQAVTYDPFAAGGFPVEERTLHARDEERGREFPCELWYPAAVRTEPRPLVLFSHSSGAGRRQSTFLCNHLSSHGYVVAAMDHSEIVAPELARKPGETAAETAARGQAWIANRVPDIQFLLKFLLDRKGADLEALLDRSRIGIVGHSFGGWTALAATEADSGIRAVVAFAPAGSSQPKPGIIPAKLTFDWGRDVPTLYIAAENDAAIPLSAMYELLERTPATKRMIILRRADHLHFMDGVEKMHEAVRAMVFPGELAWLPGEMKPISELCSGEQAQLLVRGLTLAHLDGFLLGKEEARQFLASGLEAELVRRHIEATVVAALKR